MKLKTRSRQFVRLIELAGWSQAETARRLDLSPGAVSQICSGKSEPRGATLQLLKLLSQGPASRQTPAQPSPQRLTSWEMDLIRRLRKIPPRQREPLLNAFDTILKATAGKD